MYGRPSGEHQKTPGSLLVSVNVAIFDFVLLPLGGPPVTVRMGGTVSWIQVWLCGNDSFPARSTAQPVNVCVPSARLVYTKGAAQVAFGPLSSLHSNVPGSFDVR